MLVHTLSGQCIRVLVAECVHDAGTEAVMQRKTR